VTHKFGRDQYSTLAGLETARSWRKRFPYAWPVFFWLTASERLDRLPLVLAASSDTTIRS